MKRVGLSALFLFTTGFCSAQSIPVVKAKALDNSEIALPNPGSRRPLILILGFSHKSGELCEVWGKKISADYESDARVSYFMMPVLEGAPSLVRPMILHGMRKNVPAHELPHFVPLYANESAWKKLVSFSTPDDAYLLVATPEGHPVWQAHGSYSDAVYTNLKQSLAALLEESSKQEPKN